MAFAHGKSTRVFVDSHELSAYVNTASATTTMEPIETTTFAASATATSAKAYLKGLRSGSITADGLFEITDIDPTATTLALSDFYDALVSQTAESAVTVLPRGVATSQPCQFMKSRLTSYDISSPVSDVVSTSLNFDGSSNHDTDNAEDVGGLTGAVMHGWVVHTGTFSLTGLAAADISSSTIDLTTELTDYGGTASDLNLGGAAVAVHVTNNASDVACGLVLQDSPDGSSWADFVDIYPSTAKLATLTVGNKVAGSNTSVDAQFRLTVPQEASWTTGDLTIQAAVSVISATQIL